MNKYVPGSIPGVDPATAQMIRELYQRTNMLQDRMDGMRVDTSPAGAKKEKPVPGILTIPGPDQDGFIRVSPDGVIVSYTSPSFGVFPYVDITVVGNVGAGTDSLHSFGLPVGTLANDGDALEVRYGGFFAGNANTKRIQINFGGQNVINIQLAQNGGLWDYDILYVRTSPTSIVSTGQMMWHFATPVGGFVNTAIAANMNSLTGLPNLNSSAIELLVQAEGVNDNDIVQRLSYINLHRPRMVKTA